MAPSSGETACKASNHSQGLGTQPSVREEQPKAGGRSATLKGRVYEIALVIAQWMGKWEKGRESREAPVRVAYG